LAKIAGEHIINLRVAVVSTVSLKGAGKMAEAGSAGVRGASVGGAEGQWWANLDQASKHLDKTIFRDLSPTPLP
jgi:hypothetical protein